LIGCWAVAGWQTTTAGGRVGPPTAPALPRLCALSYDAGSCGDTYVRYYYDAGERTCRPFNYTGCLGNDNNFLNFADCMAVCARPPATSTTHRSAFTARRNTSAVYAVVRL